MTTTNLPKQEQSANIYSMKVLIAILFCIICVVAGTAAPIIVMEKSRSVTNGYTYNSLQYNYDFKYPLIVTEQFYNTNNVTVATAPTKVFKYVADHILVKVKSVFSEQQLIALCKKYDLVVREKLPEQDMYLLGSDTVDIGTARNMVMLFNSFTGIVEYAELDSIIELQDNNPNDHYFTNGVMWSRTKIDCPKAWDLSVGTGGVIVAIVDSGIDYTHPDLAANMWVNPGETGIDSNGVNMATNGIDDDANGFVDDVYGWDFCNNDNDPMDDHSHGTHCAGQAGAVGNNVTGIVGVCWNIKLMALKFVNSSGGGTLSDAIKCFDYVTMMRQKGINVRITSNSWIDDYSSALEDAIADNRDEGVLCIAAAGNHVGNIDDNPVYPACLDLDNVISITGTDINDNLYVSDVAVGVQNVDLGAPAKDVYLTTPGGYGIGTGTSYATPIVAGTAALLWEYAPGLSYRDVKKAIMDGVDPVSALQGKSVTGGRLNVFGALKSIYRGGVICVK